MAIKDNTSGWTFPVMSGTKDFLNLILSDQSFGMKKLILCFLALSGFLAILADQNPLAVFKIHSQATHEKPVNPLIYGNFIELGLARKIECLWVEKLYNASFKEVPPLKSYMYDWLGKSPDGNFLPKLCHRLNH